MWLLIPFERACVLLAVPSGFALADHGSESGKLYACVDDACSACFVGLGVDPVAAAAGAASVLFAGFKLGSEGVGSPDKA